MSNIQAGEMNDENDLKSLLEHLEAEKSIRIGSGINRKLHSFKAEMDQIILKNQDIVEMAKIGTYFNDSIAYKRKEDVVNYSIKNNTIIVNYNMNPYEIRDVKHPNFISMVLRYVDKIDLGRYLDFNDAAEFEFVLTSFTNSLERSEQ